jgi:hypothetical protein
VGLAEVLRRHGPAYLAAHPLSAAKAKVWRAILACRTPALGGQVQTCRDCGTTRRVYHSCLMVSVPLRGVGISKRRGVWTARPYDSPLIFGL